MTKDQPHDPPPPSPKRTPEVAAAFLKLGCIAFGGPVAHLAFFRDEFVNKRRWLADDDYADTVALCQFLPGPASSQVVFALGMKRAGLLGALAASLAFMAPSVAVMIAFAYGVSAMGDTSGAGWLHGLKLAAVAVVAQAVWNMGRRLCPDATRITLALLAAALTLIIPSALSQIGAIALAAVAGLLLFDADETNSQPPPRPDAKAHAAAGAALLTFLILLIALPIAAKATDLLALDVVDGFYRAGSLVFGGGHVVLPLLQAEVVPPGWVTNDTFLAGYGAAQAVPGPLFTFASFLGASINPGPSAWAWGLMTLGAIYLPAWLLVGGMLPFWDRLRAKPWARSALTGANAAVVGILLAALYTPVSTQAIKNPADLAAVLVAFALLYAWKLPPWALVILMAAVGQWILPLADPTTAPALP